MMEPDANSFFPNHIAIIMDGNGRWAAKRHRDRVFGHIKGARVAKKIVESCVHYKLKHLTLYAFSEENWGRPESEVNFLMLLLSRYIKKERETMIKNNIRFRCIGQLEKIPAPIVQEIETTMKLTRDNTGLSLTFALSYGGRQEITRAVKNIAELVESKKLSVQDINEPLINQMMQTAPAPDPELLIRTSGECRLSNFLPWQTVYSELYFTDILWPDFKREDFSQAIAWYESRERRFGKTTPTLETPTPLHQ